MDADAVCEHGTAMDMHCCNCHSGFLFDTDSCVCDFREGVMNDYVSLFNEARAQIDASTLNRLSSLENDIAVWMADFALHRLIAAKDRVRQTVDEMRSAVELSKQMGTPVSDHQLILDWANQLENAL